ncbi:MAG: aldolase [Ruminococcaceae bacterium]|nr:aldolase [Oscillospiraceae bacterium]
MNILKEKLKNKERILGTLVSLTDACLCEIMGNIGYDCVWIDTEHTYMSYKDVLCHLNAARSAKIPAIVRLPQDDLTATKRILEMGPDGIIFPMVQSANELKKLIETTLYPPYGTRGFGPLRAIGYGKIDALEYVKEKSFEMCRFVQIEHIDMINELDEIIKNPYIDGFIFGPNDLSGSLGDFLNVYGEKTMAEIQRASYILKNADKAVGLAGGMGEQDIKIWSDLKLDMLFAGADWCFVYNQGKNTLKAMKAYSKKGHN